MLRRYNYVLCYFCLNITILWDTLQRDLWDLHCMDVYGSSQLTHMHMMSCFQGQSIVSFSDPNRRWAINSWVSWSKQHGDKTVLTTFHHISSGVQQWSQWCGQNLCRPFLTNTTNNSQSKGLSKLWRPTGRQKSTTKAQWICCAFESVHDGAVSMPWMLHGRFDFYTEQ